MHIIENWDLEWYIHCDVNSNDKVILGVCLFHPVFFSDVLGDVIGVTTISTVQTGLYPITKAILPIGLFSKAENWRRF